MSYIILGGGGNRPCMKWKLIGAIKNQNGYPGFLPPNQTRYLVQTITTSIFEKPDGNFRGDLSGSQTGTFDRLTGAVTLVGEAKGFQPSPYGADLSQNPPWQTVSDDHFIWTFDNDEFYGSTEATLSQPYTLAQLDADAGALIAAVDPATVDWDTLVVNQYAEVSPPFGGNFRDALPAQALTDMPDIYGPGPVFISKLTSAAWYVYATGEVGPFDWTTNGYMKMTAIVALAGNYCEKTFLVDLALNQLNATCVSGTGACAAPFKVNPPPLVAGQNAYVQIVPNCQCGG